MSYQYYRQNAPGWGTDQLQLGAPPPLRYQPLESWDELDYYRAHVMGGRAEYDPAFYQNAVNRARMSGTIGSTLYDAERWHRHAYGGVSELARMLPAEVGAAGAYEAWRQYRYNMSHYGHLNSINARRGALYGLAVAEAVRLWRETGRGFDQSGTSVAAEAAAATIQFILNQTQGGVNEFVGGTNLGPGALDRGPGAGGPLTGGLAGDNLVPNGYHRGRRRSSSAYDHAYERGRQLSLSPLPGRAPLYPAHNRSPMGVSPVPMPPASAPGYQMSSVVPYGGGVGAQVMPTGAPTAYAPSGYHGSTYPGQYVPPATAAYAAGYAPTYANGQMQPMYAGGQQQPVVVVEDDRHRHGHRHGRHRHHHRHHLGHRHRSLDRDGYGYAY